MWSWVLFAHERIAFHFKLYAVCTRHILNGRRENMHSMW